MASDARPLGGTQPSGEPQERIVLVPSVGHTAWGYCPCQADTLSSDIRAQW